MNRFRLASVVFFVMASFVPADVQPRLLPADKWKVDREQLFGDWHTEASAAKQVWFSFHHRREGMITFNAFNLVVGGNLDKQQYLKLHDKAWYVPSSEVRLLIPGGAPLGYVSYKFEKETLVLTLSDGDYQGVFHLHRMTRLAGVPTRPLGRKEAVADLEKLSGKWATDPKLPLIWKVGFELQRVDNKLLGARLSFDVGPKPRLFCGADLSPSVFWSTASGERRFLMIAGIADELDVLEYSIEGDDLILAVSEGKAEGIYRLHRVK